MRDDDNQKLINYLETLLTALEMHPMFTRQSFTILRWNLKNMIKDDLSLEIIHLKVRFAAMPDDQLFAAWTALHNPLMFSDRVLN